MQTHGIISAVRILLVEDEANLREGIVDLLVGDGHEVVAKPDGTQGLTTALTESFDVIVLDWMLPGVAGIDICRRVRSAKPAVPILMLTARGDESDKVRGLHEGADDYVTKPFSARELLARVRALGRRSPGVDAQTLEVDGAAFDFARLTVTRNGVTTELTAREVGLLRLLSSKTGKVVSRGEILEQVFGQRGDLQTRAVDMAIAVLRKKIEKDASDPRLVISIKGAGYAWGASATK